MLIKIAKRMKISNDLRDYLMILTKLHLRPIALAKKEISDSVLKFYIDLNECYLERKPNCLFLSSVIQYLEDPYQWLETFVNLEIDFILLDRMPFSKTQKEFIQIQEVPSSIYKASYPLHILSEEKIINLIIGHYKQVEEFFSTVPPAHFISFDIYL